MSSRPPQEPSMQRAAAAQPTTAPPPYRPRADDQDPCKCPRELTEGRPDTLSKVDMQVGFKSNLTAGSTLELEWEAYMQVLGDVPQLMRDGFCWTEANIQHECGYFRRGRGCLRPELAVRGWNHCRIYHLAAHGGDGAQRWFAILFVCAREVSVLAGFRVGHLSVDHIYSAQAWNKKGEEIYHFSARFPELNFNAIYDKKKLKGWWPQM